MQRREFLVKACKVGGLAALYSLGVGRNEAEAIYQSSSVGYQRNAAVAGGPSFLIDEHFTTGSTPSGWTVDAGSPVFNLAPALEGDYSARLAVSDAVTSVSFSAQPEVWVRFLFRFGANPSANSYLFRIGDGTNPLLDFVIRSTGATRAYTGAVFDTGGVMSTGTLYYVWLHYVKGTGTDSVGELYFETTGTRGPAEVSFSTGTGTTDATEIILMQSVDTTTSDYDQIQISASDPGDF